jgi:hypothetical protein
MIHESIMKQRYLLFRRAGVFYYEDTTTGKQLSLRTKDEAEARTLLNARNESFRQPVLNRQIARTYLAATDSAMATRIWQVPTDEMTKTKTGPTRHLQARNATKVAALSHNDSKSGSSTAISCTVFSSIAIAFFNHLAASSN